MKVLMTADTVGGVWTYALELARALAPLGVETELATMGAPLRPDQWAEASEIPGLTIHESAYKLEWMEDPWYDVGHAGDWLLDLEARLEPDVIHLNGFVHGCLPFRAPRLVVGHSCVLSWFRSVRGEDAPWYCDYYRERVTQGLRGADVVAAPTRAMLDALETHYGPFARTVVIPNGRSLPSSSSSVSKEPFILAVGRLWDEAKNVGFLDWIAPRLPWPVYLAGEGGREGEDLPRIHLLGRLSGSEVIEWMSRASIYALPARYEPFGLSILEAALSGCALVLGDIPSLRENWDNGAALFVPPCDGDALADAILRLINDDALRTQIAARAKERARLFTPAAMAAGYRRLYDELIVSAAGRQVSVTHSAEVSVCA
jgi:glycogen synthase